MKPTTQPAASSTEGGVFVLAEHLQLALERIDRLERMMAALSHQDVARATAAPYYEIPRAHRRRDVDGGAVLRALRV